MDRSEVAALSKRIDTTTAHELRKLRRRRKNRSSQAKSSHTRRAREIIFMEENERLRQENARVIGEKERLKRENTELMEKVEKLERTISLMSSLDTDPEIDLDIFELNF